MLVQNVMLEGLHYYNDTETSYKITFSFSVLMAIYKL